MSSVGPATLDELSEHWDASYASGEQRTSWFQDEPETSLQLIEALAPDPAAVIVDVGGGASPLAGSLLARGHTDVTVVDASEAGMRAARRRLGDDARAVGWHRADLLAWTSPRPIDVWHDRAVLHFLTRPDEVDRYVVQIDRHLSTTGGVVIGGFAADGPTRCSGLPAVGREPEELLRLLGPGFALVATRHEDHRTPGGAVQRFAWLAARRR